MLATLSRAAASVSSLAVLILIFVLIFALLGKELFGRLHGGVAPADSRMNFDGPAPSLITMMVLFSGEWFDFYLETTLLAATATDAPAKGGFEGNTMETFIHDDKSSTAVIYVRNVRSR